MCGVVGLLVLVDRCARLVVVCAVSLASWRLFTAVRAWCVVGAVSSASWQRFTSVRAWGVVCAVSLAS